MEAGKQRMGGRRQKRGKMAGESGERDGGMSDGKAGRGWRKKGELEYVSARGVKGNRLEWARRECMDRERWRFICRGHPLWGRFWRERGIGAID